MDQTNHKYFFEDFILANNISRVKKSGRGVYFLGYEQAENDCELLVLDRLPREDIIASELTDAETIIICSINRVGELNAMKHLSQKGWKTNILFDENIAVCCKNIFKLCVMIEKYNINKRENNEKCV